MHLHATNVVLTEGGFRRNGHKKACASLSSCLARSIRGFCGFQYVSTWCCKSVFRFTALSDEFARQVSRPFCHSANWPLSCCQALAQRYSHNIEAWRSFEPMQTHRCVSTAGVFDFQRFRHQTHLPRPGRARAPAWAMAGPAPGDRQRLSGGHRGRLCPEAQAPGEADPGGRIPAAVSTGGFGGLWMEGREGGREEGMDRDGCICFMA